MGSAAKGLAALCAALAIGCGGDGVDAPATPPPPDCKKVDAYLGGVYALLDQGKLGALRAAVSEGVPEDTRRDLVSTLIRLAARFEEGTFSALAGILDAEADATTSGLQATLGRLLRWVAAEGPGAPYPATLRTLRGVLNSCEGPPMLRVLKGALGDEALLRAAADLLGDDGLGDVLADFSFEGNEGREALRLLLRNLLVSAGRPDFELRTITDLLGFVVDVEQPPWPALIEGLERLLGPGPGLDAVQAFLACLLDVDPEVAFGPLLWDLLTSDVLGLADVIGALPPPGEPVLAPEIAGLLTTTLSFLEVDAEARRALVSVLTELLRDAVAPAVLIDVADLLDAEVLGEVVELVAALANGTCR